MLCDYLEEKYKWGMRRLILYPAGIDREFAATIHLHPWEVIPRRKSQWDNLDVRAKSIYLSILRCFSGQTPCK